MKTIVIILGIIFIGLLGTGIYLLLQSDEESSVLDPVSETATTTVNQIADNMVVKIAVLDLEGEEGVMRACDGVVLVDRTVPQSVAVLTAALEELFALNSTTVNGHYNFIANTNDTLQFDHATVEDGVASIYLTGELSGLSGVCDNPRAAIQIEETALQFPTVESVQLYLNEEPTTLIPSEQGE